MTAVHTAGRAVIGLDIGGTFRRGTDPSLPQQQGQDVLGFGLHQPALQQSFTNCLAVHGISDVRVLHTEPVFGVMHLAEKAALAAP